MERDTTQEDKDMVDRDTIQEDKDMLERGTIQVYKEKVDKAYYSGGQGRLTQHCSASLPMPPPVPIVGKNLSFTKVLSEAQIYYLYQFSHN